MAALSKNVLELIKRREECFSSALEKIEHILDLTKVYKMKQNQELIKMTIDDLKSKTKTQQILDGQQARVVRYFEHTVPTDFIKDTVSLCEDVYNNIASQEVNEYKKEIKKIVDLAEEDVIKYKKSLSDMTYLYSRFRGIEMEHNINSIQRDLTSCLNYNNKIEKEMSYD